MEGSQFTPPTDPNQQMGPSTWPSMIPGLATGQLLQTNPVQAQPSNLDTALQQESLASSKFGREESANELARIRGYEDQAAKLSAQAAQQAGGLSYHPHMSPITGQGAGRDILNLLGDIGKGALAGLAATKPGQAIQAVAYGKPREQYAETLRQIKENQAAAEAEKSTLSPLTSMAYHPMMAMARGMQAEAQGRHFTNQDAVALQRLDQAKWKELQELPLKAKQLEIAGKKVDAEAVRNQILVKVAEITSSARNFATQAGIDNNEMDNWIKEQISNLTQAGAMAKEHPYGEKLGLTPEAPQLPTGPKPVRKAGAGASQATKHVAGGAAGGLKEGATGTGSDGNKYVVKGGKWVPAQ